MLKKPCAGNRSLHTRIRKRLNIRVPKPYSVSDRLKTIPKNHPFRIRLLGSRLSGYGFADTGSWVLDSGYGFLDTVFVFRIRLSGAPNRDFVVQKPRFTTQATVSEKPYPENQSRRHRIQKTLSRKPGPKKPYPQNRTQKAGTKKTDPKRIWFLVGGFLDLPARASDFWARYFRASDFWARFFRASDFWARFFGLGFLNFGFWNTVFCLPGYWIGLLGYGCGDRDMVVRDSCRCRYALHKCSMSASATQANIALVLRVISLLASATDGGADGARA